MTEALVTTRDQSKSCVTRCYWVHLADVVRLWIIRCLCLYHFFSCISRFVIVVVRVAVGFTHKSTVSSNAVACNTQELYAGIGNVVILMHVLCVSAPTVALTSWNANSMWFMTGRSGNLRALFVRVGISQSHLLHALNNCLRKMEPRHLRSLRSPALSSIRSNHLLVFHQTLHSILSRCDIAHWCAIMPN